uniref:F-box domain-containing protein n=1 Tax=Leersia perrieri TaxID=77586 RepID=A0A0D9V2L0_9ORYZ
MDSDGEEGDMTYREVAEYFNSMDDPPAQDRVDTIIPYLISILPAPFIPAPPDAAGSSSDDFSLTSSDSDEDDSAAVAVHTFPTTPGDGGKDHISSLPDDVLSEIVSRLSTKEAARTMGLSTRWRGVWGKTPLVVDDAHLRNADESHEISLVRAISRCVDAHPGPVRGARVTHLGFYHHEYALRRLVASLADKAVEDLILFNRPWPLDMPLPDDILRCGYLRRLYLGAWMFPNVAAAAASPPALANLRELGLFHCIITNRDFDALLSHCDKLEILSLAASFNCPSRLRLASPSLRVVVDWMSAFEEIVVDDAPCLERLLLCATIPAVGSERTPVRIIRAPRLEVLGVLDLQVQALEIGGTSIRPGMFVRSSAKLPSLKILAVKVCLAIEQHIKMLVTLLKCFPHLETLHIKSIYSIPCASPGIKNYTELWKSLDSCECLKSHLKTVTLQWFWARYYELLCLNYLTSKGNVLETVAFFSEDDVSFVYQDDVLADISLVVRKVIAKDRWSFQSAIDLSLDDPFCYCEASPSRTGLKPMDAAGEEQGMVYEDVVEYYNNLEDAPDQECIDRVIPYLISFLPAPLIPAPPDAASSSSSSSDFSLTSSDSEDEESAAAAAHSFPSAPGDGEDHISRLPDDLLAEIVSRLTTREAARTMAVSTRWRDVWPKAPLVLDDAHLGGGGAAADETSHLVRAVSRCVDAHPGPVRAARVTRVAFYHHELVLRRLVASLADKGVEDLVLFNRPWPLHMQLPDDILRCAYLQRLYLGVWMFPNVAAAARPPAFVNLRELGLFRCIILDRHFDILLQHCHKLEVLSLAMSDICESCLRLFSPSLRVAVEWTSSVDEVHVDAPCLERLLIQTIPDSDSPFVGIVRAPRLEVLGVLDLQIHGLEIGGTTIRPGMFVGSRAKLPSLKILAVKVRLAIEREISLLVTLLQCFPYLENLHIKSIPCTSPDIDADDCMELWSIMDSCECLESHLKIVSFQGFHAKYYELFFLGYLTLEGKVLKTVAFYCEDDVGFVYEDDVAERTSLMLPNDLTKDRWCFQSAIDLSLDDPFCCAACAVEH